MQEPQRAVDYWGRARGVLRLMPDAEARRAPQQEQLIHVATTRSAG